MKLKTPLKLLEDKYAELNVALSKSKAAYAIRDIDIESHLIHMKNLIPMINLYKKAILKLKS